MRYLILLAALVAAPASAQLSIGGQVGDPTGLSLKLGSGQGALAIALGWDLDDSLKGEVHYLLSNNRLRSTRNPVYVFYGPGAFVDTNDRRTRAGISLGVGLEAALTPDLELYGIVSPRLQLTDETDFEVGGGIGLRLRL
ncbi:hypothetical protein [Rubrivirga sp.]|uniref:hypothetical protein n=1 Tax=Rubrivirga sp. TaxID=1885344 RepID=UPI003C773D53